MIRALFFLSLIILCLKADVKYDIFITSFTKDNPSKAKEYQKILKEYLKLQNINQKVSLSEEASAFIIKIVNFDTLNEAKKTQNIISSDFKDSFIQEKSLNNLDETHQKAMESLKNEKPNIAYNTLLNSYENNIFNNQTIFLLATSAKQKGDTKTAIYYFETLLELDPNAHRARLELASLYYEEQEFEKSNEQFLIVKSAQIPKQVESNIDNFKIKKQQEKQKNYNLSANLAYIKDSNVNLGPTIDTISLYGVDFTLSSNAKETDDNAISFRAGGELFTPFKSFALRSSLNINKLDYSKQDAYDTTSFSIGTTPMIFRGKSLYMMPISFAKVDIGTTDSYLQTISISPMLKNPLFEALNYSIKLKLEKKQYKALAAKDGLTYGLTYGLEFLENDTRTISFDTYLNRNSSDDSIYSYYNVGSRLTYGDIVYPRVFLVGSVNYETSSYDKAEDAFTSKKDEHNLNGTINIIYDLNYYNSNVSFSYYKQRNSSNISLYEYDRSMATLAFNMRY